MTTRKLSHEQLADGTVLDCERFEQVINDAFERLNNIGPDVDTSSMVQKQFVWGETPPRWDWDWNYVSPTDFGLYVMPWLPTTILDPDGNITERLKSNDPYGYRGVQTDVPGNTSSGWCWQTSFWTEEPIVVTDLDIVMHMNSEPPTADRGKYPYYENPFQTYWNLPASNAPYPLNQTEYTQLEDVVVSMVVDSPYNQQVASEVNLTIHKNFFSLNSQRMTEIDSWSTPDMEPNLTHFKFARGIWMQAKEVNAPIPAKSRVRVNIFIPHYNQQLSDPSPINWWKYNSTAVVPTEWARTLWSGTLTYLERKA